MPKKTISLAGLMDEFGENIEQTKQKKTSPNPSQGGELNQGSSEHPDHPAGITPPSEEKGGGRSKGSAWRQEERPFRKTIHFDPDLNQLINLVSKLHNIKIEDLIYTAVQEHIHTHYGKNMEEIIKKS